MNPMVCEIRMLLSWDGTASLVWARDFRTLLFDLQLTFLSLFVT
jgi:hypothetical protein